MKKEEYSIQIMVWILIITGILLVFLAPPLAVPDENTHFVNSYCISKGDLFADVQDECMGRWIPRYVFDFVQSYNGKYTGQYDVKYGFGEQYFSGYLCADESQREMVFWQSRVANINPFSYVISALGIKGYTLLCRLFGLDFDTAYNLLIAARLGNLLFYIVVGTYAVKITPVLKRTMMLLLTMPVTMMLGASVSYDAILIPTSFLFFGELFRLILNKKEEKVNWKDILIVDMSALILCAIKTAYAPFIILLLAIPFVKFRSKKQYILSIVSVICMGFIGLVLPKLLMTRLMGSVNNMGDELIAIQRDYLLQHIGKIPSLIVKTIVVYREFYITSFIGKVGCLDTNFPIPLIFILLSILFYVTVTEICMVEKIDWKLKCGAFGIFLFILGAMIIEMYIGWTPLVEAPMGETASGIQGRYFIPMYCFGCTLFFNSFGINNHKLKKFLELNIQEEMVRFFMVISAITMVITMIVRYWV